MASLTGAALMIKNDCFWINVKPYEKSTHQKWQSNAPSWDVSLKNNLLVIARKDGLVESLY